MKLPVMLSSYLCGECGIEMLLDRRDPRERLAGSSGPTVVVACYTPSCKQQGLHYEVTLHSAPVLNTPGKESQP